MSHYAAFVITSETAGLSGGQPTPEQLRRAAAQAEAAIMKLLAETPEDSSAYPESIAVGCRQYRFIQGNLRTNSEHFGVNAPVNLDDSTFEIWSQRHGPKAPADQAPDKVISISWNCTEKLVKLALESHQRPRPLYPQLLITPDGQLQHQLEYPDLDVFDDPAPGGAASKYLAGDPANAWHRAKQPIHDLEQAYFRIRYLQTLSKHPERIVLEFDWNL